MKVEENDDKLISDEQFNSLKSDSESEAYDERKQRRKCRNPFTKNEQATGVARNKTKSHDFKCFICGKMFDKVGIKTRHIKDDHATELFCKVCNLKKPSPISTEQCLKDHAVGFDYLCQVCVVS